MTWCAPPVRGKPFWHAEPYGGPLWMQPQVINKPRNEGRIASPEDIRYWTMASLMAGASGFMYLRWRPLLDGPLFGAFGAYGMDGSRTPRSEMVSKLGQWIQAPEQSKLCAIAPGEGRGRHCLRAGDAVLHLRSAGQHRISIPSRWRVHTGASSTTTSRPTGCTSTISTSTASSTCLIPVMLSKPPLTG